MREQILRYAHVPPGVVGHGAVRISIPVIHEGVRIAGVQAVVAPGIFLIGVQRRGCHRRGDGLRRDLLFSLFDAGRKRRDFRLVRLARHHEAQVGVGRDVRGVQSVDGGLACEQRVHVQIGGNQGTDDGVIAEDILYIQCFGRNAALDDLLAAVDAQIGHIVIGHLFKRRNHISTFIYGNRIEMPVRTLDPQLAHSQGNHVCFSHSQLGNIQFACCALRDDSRIGG